MISFKKSIHIIIFIIIFLPAVCLAQGQGNFEDISGLKNTAGEEGIGYSTEDRDLAVFIGTLIQYALAMVGIAFMIILFIGYMKYSGAGGNEEEAIQGKKWIKNGMWGVLIVLAAYLVTALAVFFAQGVVYKP